MNQQDNKILIEAAKIDQRDRALLILGQLTFEEMKSNDEERLKVVEDQYLNNKIHTILDYRNAALVYHHSRIRNEYCRKMAVDFMRKSADLDNYKSIGIKWLLAASIDRELMQKNEPQIYGTQYIKNEKGLHELYELDTNKISDKEREEYGVPTVEQQVSVVERMNKKQLVDLYKTFQNIDELIVFYEHKSERSEEYDLSWQAISQFGFYLKRIGKFEESLKIFHSAIKLYPLEFDLYHSLGIFYEELGNIDKAIEFIQRSIELFPDFHDGIKDLNRIKKDQQK